MRAHSFAFKLSTTNNGVRKQFWVRDAIILVLSQNIISKIRLKIQLVITFSLILRRSNMLFGKIVSLNDNVIASLKLYQLSTKNKLRYIDHLTPLFNYETKCLVAKCKNQPKFSLYLAQLATNPLLDEY